MAYASRTGTRRNLAALRAAGWRLLVSAKGVLRTEGFLYGLDNGAWSAFQAKRPFDEAAFLKAYELLAAGADFVVLPDIVAGGLRSLDYSMEWQQRLGKPLGLQLIAVQDGMTPTDIRPLIGSSVGIFVGGTTEWKERTLPIWGALARERAAYLHVARVNTRRRIALCAQAGADSFDGSSASKYVETLPMLEDARRQTALYV